MTLLVHHGAQIPKDLVELRDALLYISDILLSLLNYRLLKLDFGLGRQLQLGGLLLDQRHGFALAGRGRRVRAAAFELHGVERRAGLDYILSLFFDGELLDGLEVWDGGGELPGEFFLDEALFGLYGIIPC